ncbi:MAG: histidinol-phosphatase [Pseudomonadota bacterium]
MSVQSSPSDFTDLAQRLADAARAQTLPRFRAGAMAENKSADGYDPVTQADREAERVMRALIKDAYPAHGIIGEEFGAEDDGAAERWVLDPVDGTRAFVAGVPTWTTLIALEAGAAPILGVIDQPYTDEQWIGVEGQTQFVRGGEARLANTSACTALHEARLSTTDPRVGEIFDEPQAAAFARVSSEARLARFSLDAYAYALLSIGELDLVIESGLQHYDYAALIPVVKGAGGVITDWRGEPVGSDESGQTLAAATPQLHQAALQRLNQS